MRHTDTTLNVKGDLQYNIIGSGNQLLGLEGDYKLTSQGSPGSNVWEKHDIHLSVKVKSLLQHSIRVVAIWFRDYGWWFLSTYIVNWIYFLLFILKSNVKIDSVHFLCWQEPPALVHELSNDKSSQIGNPTIFVSLSANPVSPLEH